ncbi:hypothetical protein B9Z51_07060 [Limnohabitans sp. T6-5]|nr:hypothetical protein B9Z51_07060 [Limnohabitans sp. T6-5]
MCKVARRVTCSACDMVQRLLTNIAVHARSLIFLDAKGFMAPASKVVLGRDFLTIERVNGSFHGRSFLKVWFEGRVMGAWLRHFAPITIISNGKIFHPSNVLISLMIFMIRDSRIFETPDLGHFFR